MMKKRSLHEEDSSRDKLYLMKKVECSKELVPPEPTEFAELKKMHTRLLS